MWFINSNNQQLGPFDERDIAVGLAQGVYNGYTMVWREGWPQWVPLAQSELAKYLPRALTSVPTVAPSVSSVSTRDRILGGIGLVWGSIALVNGVVSGLSSTTGFLFSIVMIVVGSYYCFGKPKRYFAAMGIGVIALIVLAAIVMPGKGPSGTRSTVTIGESVRTDQFEIVVTSASERSSVGTEPFAKQPSSGATFVAVQVTYKNISKRPIGSFSMPDVYLVSPDGVRFDPDIGASMAFATQLDLDRKALSDLNPGVTVGDGDVFEVAQDQFEKTKWKILVDADEPVYVTFQSAEARISTPATTPQVQSQTAQPVQAPSQPTNASTLKELNQIMSQRSYAESYFQSAASSTKTGEQLATDYMTSLFAQCADGMVAFTATAPQSQFASATPDARETQMPTFTLWQWRELELVGFNVSTLTGKQEVEEAMQSTRMFLTYGLFSLDPNLLDEQSRLNEISGLAGFDDEGRRYAFYRYRVFGTSESDWSAWFKSGQHSPNGLPPRFSFLVVKHQGKWTANYRLPIGTIEDRSFHTGYTEFAQLNQVVTASKDATSFLKKEGCKAFQNSSKAVTAINEEIAPSYDPWSELTAQKASCKSDRFNFAVQFQEDKLNVVGDRYVFSLTPGKSGAALVGTDPHFVSGDSQAFSGDFDLMRRYQIALERVGQLSLSGQVSFEKSVNGRWVPQGSRLNFACSR